MAQVQVEVHKGIADITKLEPGIEVELVDLDMKEVIHFSRKGDRIDWHVLSTEELLSDENS